jgi:hypothetical protein
MRFRGSNPREIRRAEEEWKRWCAFMNSRPQLRDVAVRLTDTIERQGSSRPNMNKLAPQTFQDAGAPLLTSEQRREVVIILKRVWVHGLSFAVWAKQQGILRPKD